MSDNEKMEYGTALLLALIKKMVKVEMDGPEVVIFTNDNHKFHIVGYPMKKENKDDLSESVPE